VDGEGVARDLHDHVIQRLFAAGLSLQAAATRVRDDVVQQRLHQVVDQLDETVRDIRTTIFDLHTTDGADHADSLRRQVLDIVTETAGEGLHSTVRMSGAVDSLVTGDLAVDVTAVVREGVSNAARHSGAAHVTVTLDVADEVVVDVRDDGRGIDDTVARSGLCNVVQRAERWGGSATVQPLPEGGTRLRWTAPLPVGRTT
jgi:signal transduction histidine kinase